MRTLAATIAAAALLGIPATTAAAAVPTADTQRVNSISFCKERYDTRTTTGNRVLTAYWIPMRYVASSGGVVVVDFPVQSLAGCITTVAPGLVDGAVPQAQFSILAAWSQCEYLEQQFGITYPYVFYGRFIAKNRYECAKILKQLVSTQPPPSQGPPV